MLLQVKTEQDDYPATDDLQPGPERDLQVDKIVKTEQQQPGPEPDLQVDKTVNTEQQQPGPEPDLQVDKTVNTGQQEDDKKLNPDEPYSNVDVAVAHFTKVKNEERETKKLRGGDGPWKRRQRMRGEHGQVIS